jgi:hypothetical protein
MADGGNVGRIPGDSGHGRARGAGQKKEEMEGVPFYRLPMAGRHRGGGNLAGKRRRCTAPWQRCWFAPGHQRCCAREACRRARLQGQAHGQLAAGGLGAAALPVPREQEGA